MPESIFSKYGQLENRVTQSILSVLRSISLQKTEHLLRTMLEEQEFELVHFQSQPSKGAKGVPDAMISCNCLVLIETKLKCGAIDLDQCRRHLARLSASTNRKQVLLLLTPDATPPDQIRSLSDDRVAWCSFADLDRAIDELLDDKTEVASERETFLLRQLQLMLEEQRLLGSASADVLVVPARHAWPAYLRYSAYVCQPDRSFRRVGYMAFYYGAAIQRYVPRILHVEKAVVLEPDSSKRPEINELIRLLTESGEGARGQLCEVFLLTGKDDERTVDLGREIRNDLRKRDAEQSVAYARQQRYTSLLLLKQAGSTSDLLD